MKTVTKTVVRFLKPGPIALGAIFVTLLVPLFALNSEALAAGDTIKIVSDKSAVRFPGGLIFNLEVEGETDIVEVRLYYRVPPSRIWTYTYPDISPSRHVEASFNLEVSGVQYIPPGSDVEYYYAIRDSRGNVLETSTESFAYVDTRFSWQNVVAGPLTLYWHDLSEERVNEVAQQVEKSLVEISSLLRVSMVRPVKGIIYNSRSEAREAFPFQSEAITEDMVFGGFAFPDRGVFVGIGFRPSLIVHESAHLLMAEAANAPGVRLPAWSNEGFATYMEPGARDYRRGFPLGSRLQSMPLRQMHAIPGNARDIRYFYRKSGSVVGYLLETYGDGKFRTFLDEINTRKDPERAMEAAYGFGQDELDRRWASALGHHEETDDAGVTFPFSSLSTILLGTLVLVVSVVVLANFGMRRLRRRVQALDDGEGLSEEEWESRP